MKLYTKIIKLTIVSIFTAICLIYFFSKILLIRNVNEIEFSKTLSNTTRVLHFIKKDMQALTSLNLEYSQWDETYEFMENHNKHFIDSNFSDDLNSFKNLNISFLAFINNSGEIIFNKTITSTLYTSSDLDHNVQRDIISRVNSFTNSKRFTGILIHNNLPIFISAQPVVKNDSSGPVKGTFILVKYFDNQALKTLSADLDLNIKVQNYDKNILENTITYNPSNNTYVKIKDKNTITGYALINDIFSAPALIITVDMPRDIYKTAENSLTLYLVILFVISLLCIILVITFLNKTIIKKILSIKTTVDEITNTGDLSHRLELKGNDEITELNKEINTMFETLQKSESKLIQLAYYDTLTGLSNRKNIMENIELIIKENKTKFALFFIDLDNFKNINDSLGHNAGDYILEKVADKLQFILNENYLLGRLGGDEFIIVQNNICFPHETKNLAEKICNVLKSPINYQNHEIYVGCSIGISFYPDNGDDLPTLMKNADSAMYVAKNSGGYTYKIYSENMNSQALTELVMENNLRKALKNNEFILHFQPINNINQLNLLGAEALIRWKFEDKLIYPNDFIQKAKDIGEIVHIDNWVLFNACKQCKKWHEKGYRDFYISVNISFNQLKQENFIDIVTDALNHSKLSPSYLNLEITEDEAMEDVSLTINTLKTLRELGVTISLDDFGTGYSSLSYVSSLPINTLKIDKSLITDIDKNTKNLEIIKITIMMAHSLNLKVVAEGIETNEHLNILKELKCDSIQGYLIGKPVEAAEFENSFLNQKTSLVE
ncbi:EAL domain-containing protein [Clostridium sp. ZS2-4]|uniref:EAL domain-containing protein n=1 Tax=Clostridium sp. ZS2-4 TaxID=2987703 RepID=UPI00227D6D50|nr:EAL domain-containing protein [Clostridium sp. ZS2-4]MCY6354297.1 EAL domain-containing protein [Clostridium sp. ZS2-4]